MTVRESNVYEQVFLLLAMGNEAERALGLKLGQRVEADKKVLFEKAQSLFKVAEALKECIVVLGDGDCGYCGARHTQCQCDDGLWFRQAVEALKDAEKP